MSIQMSLIFVTLCTQMIVLLVLVLPLPFPVRSKIVDASRAIKKNKNVRTGIVFFGVLLILQFLDSYRKVLKYDQFGHRHNHDVPLSADLLASKFYAQRNLYLLGAVLFSGMAIGTVIAIVDKMVVKESQYREITQAGKQTAEGIVVNPEDLKKIHELKEQLKKKDLDIETLKKQLNGLQKAYDSLSTGTATKKSD